MSAANQSSGDLVADRRFAYGCGCVADGDHAAAVEMFEQTIERTATYAPAWFELGKARLAAGLPDAAPAFLRALAIEPDDRLGASLFLSRLARETPDRDMPPAYVVALFDQYASRFDAHLTGTLNYDGPHRLREAVESVCRDEARTPAFATAFDLGCGTGLVGACFAELCAELIGCDLSDAMLAQAGRKAIYGELERADAIAFLLPRPKQADLVLAGDLLPYLRDPVPLFEAAAASLTASGLFALTLQCAADPGPVLGEDLRFSHSRALIEAAARQAGFRVALFDERSMRLDRGTPVPGAVAVLALG